ncbi:putative bifunctional diguanylate cyclase/phosphodiesterase [Legionella israelensis]|uniref:Inner membrane protein/sensory box protein LssE n=1 Tax=Legionella israelensis TaxID=454 RepID=A0A0W0V4F6_9GAMM|nr:GGDEF domain-containing phosphodiesterase [Legionella israelensis]KTD14994.1 inner membrane protein/sensory box protein LssE [Legionella israelensis]SCX78134.1 diguanylate cyclase (GGDEF) domain-containing protein [Legionella israelensis DSM 19235]STX59590.1 inner membrane protein PLUS sensory box protein LssE [Legionella israelensis]
MKKMELLLQNNDLPSHQKKDRIKSAAIFLIYKQIPLGIVCQLVVALFLVMALYHLINPFYLLSWFLTLSCLSALFLFFYRIYPKARQITRLSLLTLFVFLLGSSWGMAGVLFVPSEYPNYQIFIAVLIFSLSAGAVIFLSSILWMYILFLLSATLPFTLWAFFQGDIYIFLGISSSIFILFMFSISYYIHQFMRTSHSLKYQNIDLVARNHRLGKKMIERSEWLTNHDLLTQLPNKPAMLDHIRKSIAYAKRFHSSLFLFFIDIDNFKIINDHFSHEEGDFLLKKIAQRLTKSVRESDTVARFGGDEFVILFLTNDTKDLCKLAEKLLHEINRPVKIENHHVIVTASIGISLYPKDGKKAGTLLKNADIAMSMAKKNGKNNFKCFEKQSNVLIKKRLNLQIDLYNALQKNEFFLLFQPIVNLKTGHIVATEALVRWQHPREGILMPSEFIPIAEESGMIIQLGQWIFYKACLQNKAWQEAGLRPIRMAVNVSAHQFKNSDFIHFIEDILKKIELKPQYIEIELTERSLMDNSHMIQQALEHLHKKGVSIAIDDFGVGYSGISYIRQFPIDKLKIDGSFICQCTSNPDDASIIKAIIGMARSLKLDVIAEGIENDAQRQFLIHSHCHEGQGFIFSPPVEGKAIVPFMKKNWKTNQVSGT